MTLFVAFHRNSPNDGIESVVQDTRDKPHAVRLPKSLSLIKRPHYPSAVFRHLSALEAPGLLPPRHNRSRDSKRHKNVSIGASLKRYYRLSQKSTKLQLLSEMGRTPWDASASMRQNDQQPFLSLSAKPKALS
jgi:hypothetical protein